MAHKAMGYTDKHFEYKCPHHKLKSSRLPARFLQLIANLHPDRPMVCVSDLDAPNDAAAMEALAYLDAGSYVMGHVRRSNGNAEGVIAISEVRLTSRGRDWLARLNSQAS